MNAKCRIESDSTVFLFSVTDKGVNDCGYFWTDAVIFVENRYFNYETSSSFLEFSEIEHIDEKLRCLLNDEITAEETLEFIEPDIQIVLKPKIDKRESDKYSFVREGYEIEDVSAEFLLFPFLGGVLTEQHYVMPLYRSDLVLLTEYLSKAIKKLK
jgi:hypothetical protein